MESLDNHGWTGLRAQWTSSAERTAKLQELQEPRGGQSANSAINKAQTTIRTSYPKYVRTYAMVWLILIPWTRYDVVSPCLVG
ncbi:hypothetical protein F503_00059 [Ophiostoma piceae UAMH 11346]|uniref:Uncharacterized protein n=1 Tax=Ophiostoma piceae (strain UAMH 11346) TaxID=1262450 RepID=S3CVU3_OPHP1|nr:hypothetical protein F503_00059 [Ophiostoma piceae UAMH 11346]